MGGGGVCHALNQRCDSSETLRVITCDLPGSRDRKTRKQQRRIPYLSKVTAPFEPTAKSGRLSPLRSAEDWLMDMPKNLSPDFNSEPAIL